jgi:aerobic carbon-monoxide dehydrogenase medium subunit
MKAFEYFEPKTIVEATELLSEYDGKAKLLAGGIDLLPRMRKGLAAADYIVSLQKIQGMDYIQLDGEGALRFGAMTRLRSLETSKSIQTRYPILYDAIHQITSVQTKYMGTAVGNLCVATPASDVATALLALGAELNVTGPKGERTEPLDRFYLGYFRISLGRGEMVREVRLPRSPAFSGSAFFNLVRTHSDIAKVSVAVTAVRDNDTCRAVTIAVGAAAPTVLRAFKAEARLRDQKITGEAIEKAAELAAGDVRPITDLRSTAEYRKEMTKVLVRRALEEAFDRARA